MIFSFEAEIYKKGINPCVDVPVEITAEMLPVKGFIRVKGKINGHDFQQTLIPVKHAAFRLFVNGPMLKGSGSKTGDTVFFLIEQDHLPKTVADYLFPELFKKALIKHKVYQVFLQLTASRQKEVLRYLGSLQTKESLKRNVDKVIRQLTSKDQQKK